ncbi:MAG: hypothetical protein M0Z59_02575 [Nitrospiraceae bacterium]|nr:hypothetical protein [Nitrospiraceae bacterium]
MNESAREYFIKGLEFLRRGDALGALYNFEKSYSLDSTSLLCKSYIALLTATERGQMGRSVKTLEEIVAKTPEEPAIYLNLGKLYIRGGKKKEAIEVVRQGLRQGPLPEAEEFLEKLGTRRTPVFRFLRRDHFLNKYSGLLIKKLGIK